MLVFLLNVVIYFFVLKKKIELIRRTWDLFNPLDWIQITLYCLIHIVVLQKISAFTWNRRFSGQVWIPHPARLIPIHLLFSFICSFNELSFLGFWDVPPPPPPPPPQWPSTGEVWIFSESRFLLNRWIWCQIESSGIQFGRAAHCTEFSAGRIWKHTC